jgi:S-adenosylmethionine:tRNA-ribosyltransferase-isomerase (queuine synthetase)
MNPEGTDNDLQNNAEAQKNPQIASSGDQTAMQIFLHVPNVPRGFFSKLDWLLLNDRIVILNLSGFGKKTASKRVTSKLKQIAGENLAQSLIAKLQELKSEKSVRFTEEEIKALLSLDALNSQILFDQISKVKVQVTFFLGSRLTIWSNGKVIRANVSWKYTSANKLRTFFKTRIGSRLEEN